MWSELWWKGFVGSPESTCGKGFGRNPVSPGEGTASWFAVQAAESTWPTFKISAASHASI